MSISRRVLLRGFQRSLGFQSTVTLNPTWIEAEQYHAVCNRKDRELYWCTKVACRRESSVSEVSKALKQPSGQQDFFKLLGM